PALTTAILDARRQGSPDELVAIANTSPPPHSAALFPRVMKTAESGDALANNILHLAGQELAALAGIAIRKLWGKDQPARVCGAGGVLKNSIKVREALAAALKQSAPHANFDPVDVEPVMGAIYL